MGLRDFLRRKKRGVKIGQYQYNKEIKLPPSPPPKREITIVADFMPLKSITENVLFLSYFANILLQPVVVRKCGCVGYFYTSGGLHTFKYIGICAVHQIKEYIIDHRAPYKCHDRYSE